MEIRHKCYRLNYCRLVSATCWVAKSLMIKGRNKLSPRLLQLYCNIDPKSTHFGIEENGREEKRKENTLTQCII